MGQTPIHYSWDRHDRISIISGLTVSPQRHRLGLYFNLQEDNFRYPAIMRYLLRVRQALGSDLIVVIDRLNAHRSAARELKEQYPGRFIFEWLPPYAPDLNPVEQVWNHTKFAELSNFLPKDIEHLKTRVRRSLKRKRTRPQLLRSFFKHAGLSL
jgi:transposase